MKRVVITGPTGAIGLALINKCIEERIEVLAICHKGSKRKDRIPAHSLVKVISRNLSELKYFEPNDNGFDVFYHLAWEATSGARRDDMLLQIRNVEYTLDAVALAKRMGCHTFIGTGSQAEYGRSDGKLSETSLIKPETGYGIAKFCAGQMAEKECQQKGLRFVWARILSVYGPYDTECSMIVSAGKLLLKGEKPQFTKGEQQWDYLFSADAAEALYLLGVCNNAEGVYTIGSGQAKPLSEYIFQLRDAIDERVELQLGEIPYSEKQVMYLCADISKLTSDTGFVPKTDFAEGIKQTVQWMKTL